MAIPHFIKCIGRILRWPFRNRRFLVYILIIGVMLYVIAYLFLKEKLNHQYDAISVAGGKLSLTDFQIEDDNGWDNAATVYRYAMSTLTEYVDSTDCTTASDFCWRLPEAKSCTCLLQRQEKEDEDNQQAISPEEEKSVDAFMRGNEHFYATLQEASTKPFCQFGRYASPMAVVSDPTANMSDHALVRELTRKMCARALWEAHQGNVEGAYAWITAAFHLINNLENDPLLITGLVRVAIQGIACETLKVVMCWKPIPSAAEPALLLELKKLSDRTVWSRFIEGERCFNIALMDTNLEESNAYFILKPLIQMQAKMNINNLFMLEMDAFCEPKYTRRVEKEQALSALLQKDVSALGNGYFSLFGQSLYVIMLPSIMRSSAVYNNAIADAECARLAILLKHYAPAYPDTLDALVPKDLNALPEDPFSGKPLIYRKEGAGFILYSVGSDGKDDKGKTMEKRTGDIVWCVPN